MLQQNLQLAMQFHQTGDLARAEALYLQILQQAPNHPDVLHLLGLVAHQTGRHDTAANLINQAISITGGSPGYYSNLGLALESLGRFNEAAAAYRKALVLKPDFTQALINLCQLLSRQTEKTRELLECFSHLASQFLSQGNIAAAEICCREVLDEDRTNPRALKTLASLYKKAGLKIDPLDPGKAIQKDNNAEPRYLLVKAWGCGFWSDVGSVLGALLLAEVTNRIPVIHWGNNSLFRDNSGEDAFGLYFEPVSTVGLRDLEHLNNPAFYPPKWNRNNLAQNDLTKWQGLYSRLPPFYYLNRKETVVVCDFFVNAVDVMPWIPQSHPLHDKTPSEVFFWLIQKYLKPRSHIREQTEIFHRSHLEGHNFVSIHIRGSDKAHEAKDLEIINRSSIQKLDGIDSDWKIFLLTDDENWMNLIKDRFGTRAVTTLCRRSGSAQGVHFLATDNDRVQIGTEVMVDTYVALRANRFIGNGWSNVSGMISVMRQWAEGECTLFGAHRLVRRNLSVYVMGM